MFKIIVSVLTQKDGAYSAQITLSGTGYDKLYMGTAEQAATDSGNWISYTDTYEYTDNGEAKTGYVAIEDEFGEVGPQDYLRKRFDLTDDHIVRVVKETIAKKG